MTRKQIEQARAAKRMGDIARDYNNMITRRAPWCECSNTVDSTMHDGFIRTQCTRCNSVEIRPISLLTNIKAILETERTRKSV